MDYFISDYLCIYKHTYIEGIGFAKQSHATYGCARNILSFFRFNKNLSNLLHHEERIFVTDATPWTLFRQNNIRGIIALRKGEAFFRTIVI